jgi:hypothetical protein
MQQKSCGDCLDDLCKELQKMLQEALWQSELFVWVTVLTCDSTMTKSDTEHILVKSIFQIKFQVLTHMVLTTPSAQYFKIHIKSTALTKNKGMELHL